MRSSTLLIQRLNMNIGNLFCNSEELPKGFYVALPVIAWDIVVEIAKISGNYFSELIKEILAVGDKSTKELHDLTNLDEGLIRHILNYNLAENVSKGIDKWHLKGNASSMAIAVAQYRITVLQSMETGHLIPHPVLRNALKTLDYDLNDKRRPKINAGTKGKPNTITPYIIFPDNFNQPNVSEDDIYAMWDEYEYNDSEFALLDFDSEKSEFLEHPEKIRSITKHSMEDNVIDYLLVKVNTFAEDKQVSCRDLLEPTPNIPMDFLARELKTYMENHEDLATFLGLKEIDIPLELKDVIRSSYPKLTDNVINEACRLFTLKDQVNEMVKEEDCMDDLLLSRFQTLYECILRGKDVLPLPDSITNIVNEITSTQRRDNARPRKQPQDILIPALIRKGLTLDSKTIELLYAKSVWRDLEKDSASLKSLVLRHLLVYLRSCEADPWFANQFANKGILRETLEFILDMAQRRNTYQHYHADRQKLPYSYKKFFSIVEQQLEIINEVY